MTMKLTEKQMEALEWLASDGTIDGSAYAIGASLSTLYALQSKGLVLSRSGLGSHAFPRTSIKWRVSEAGRRTLEDKEQ